MMGELACVVANQRFPNSNEIDAIKKEVSKRVTAAVSNKVSCWNGFWSDQDDFIGVAGDENTLFTASGIRTMAGKGRIVRQTPIRGTEITLRATGAHQFEQVVREHHYVLSWSIQVDLIPPEAFPFEQIEQTGAKLAELDLAIAGLAKKLRSADEQLGTKLQVEIEEKVKRIRPTLVRDFEVAWAAFAKTLSEGEKLPRA